MKKRLLVLMMALGLLAITPVAASAGNADPGVQRSPACRVKAGQTPLTNGYSPVRVLGSNKELAGFADVNAATTASAEDQYLDTTTYTLGGPVHYDGEATRTNPYNSGSVTYYMSLKMSVGHEVNDPECFFGDRWRFRAHSWCWKTLPDGLSVTENCNHRITQAHYDIKPCWPDASCGYDTVGAANFGTLCSNTVHCYFDGGWHGPYSSGTLSVRSRALDWQVRFRSIDHVTGQYDVCSKWVYVGAHTSTYSTVCTP